MEAFYVACDLGVERGRMSLGTLNEGRLHLSEIRSFQISPTTDRDGPEWNVAHLYQQVISGLGEVAMIDEPVQTISCTSWSGDYMLFDAQGALIRAACLPPNGPRKNFDNSSSEAVSAETIYEETGAQPLGWSTFVRLRGEKARRLAKVGQVLPMADGFNYLLSGKAMVDASMASMTQMFNPFKGNWSDRLIEASGLPRRILPPVVPSGTVLGSLRKDISAHTRLEDVEVVSACSHELASALVAMPVPLGSDWAFLRLGSASLMGTELDCLIANRLARDLQFTNSVGFGNTVCFSKPTAGLYIADQCHRFWVEQEQGFDWKVLMHLAASSPPFEALINPMDPIFRSPEDMPLKVRTFCKETGQRVPRKPGPIMRCVLESMALYFRRTLEETERISGKSFDRIYLMGREAGNPLLHHFLANALELPVIIVADNAASIGSVLVQAIAKGQISSLEEARKIVSDSFPFETIQPHASAWHSAYERLHQLM